MKARVSITRTMSNMEDDFMTIRLQDDTSSTSIVEAKMTMADLMYTLSGQADRQAEITRLLSSEELERVGKKKVVKRVTCEKVARDKQAAKVVGHFLHNSPPGEWLLQDDGTSSQQNSEKHIYTICQYVENE